jgi:aryl-alcohol dehydrogenase-like predicted oxidoreductase
MKALDAWRDSIGLTFECETAEGLAAPVSGRPLQTRPGAEIPTGSIAGVDKPVSRIILGTMSHVVGTLPKTFAMLDHYYELGGRTLDTAWVYGTEEQVGQWIAARDVRDEIVLIAKGAGTIEATPELVSEQLLDSLDRFGTDYVDLWLMHRDNPAVPVGEFVDVLNEHRQAGRIRALGGSNWSVERLQAANAYAAANGLTPFAASSPNFSLAAWNEPMWADCIAAVDRASRNWYEETRMPLLAWSSQANGFFAGHFRRKQASDPALANIVRVWFNDANFARLERVRELAARKGVGGIEIALAYVLCQPLNIFAMIGPQTFDEMETSLAALRLRLTPDEMAWLNLEA